MSVAESFESTPENKQAELLSELDTRTESVTIEYDDGNAAYEGLVVRVTGTPARLRTLFSTKHPYIRQYRIVSSGEPPVGDK